MILCSKRAFLNVLTQIWTRDLLLNANYYILDQAIGGRHQSKLRASDDGGFDIKKCVTNVNLASTCSPKLSKQDICSENDFPNSAHFFRDVLHLT